MSVEEDIIEWLTAHGRTREDWHRLDGALRGRDISPATRNRIFQDAKHRIYTERDAEGRHAFVPSFR